MVRIGMKKNNNNTKTILKRVSMYICHDEMFHYNEMLTEPKGETQLQGSAAFRESTVNASVSFLEPCVKKRELVTSIYPVIGEFVSSAFTSSTKPLVRPAFLWICHSIHISCEQIPGKHMQENMNQACGHLFTQRFYVSTQI